MVSKRIGGIKRIQLSTGAFIALMILSVQAKSDHARSVSIKAAAQLKKKNCARNELKYSIKPPGYKVNFQKKSQPI